MNTNPPKDTLIIGNGYIGSALRKIINSDVVTDYNQTTREDLFRYKSIVFTAHRYEMDNFRYIHENVYDFRLFLEKLSGFPGIFIYLSSAMVYSGTSGIFPITEDQHVRPATIYTMSKLLAEKFIESAGLNSYCLRLGSVNGYNGQKNKKENVINSMLISALQDDEIMVSNPETYRPILCLNDLTRAILRILEKPFKESSNRIYNLSSFNCKIGDIAKKVSKTLNVPIIEKKENDPYSFSINSDKFERDFEFRFIGTLDSIVTGFLQNYTKVKKLDKCLVCRNKVELVLDLGRQPLANNFQKTPTEQETFPLKLMVCKSCFHSQLSHSVHPEILFQNYHYLSGTSKTMNEYFNWIADLIKKRTSTETSAKTSTETPSENLEILEIASNDGTQLDCFRKLGYKTFGVDPATNIVEKISPERGHTLYNDFFGETFAKKIDKKFPIILAQNVVAHVNDLGDFFRAAKTLLEPNGTFYVQTSQAKMYQNGEFDTIYHEHMSFFSVESMRKLCELNRFRLERVEITAVHGGSFLFTIRHDTAPNLDVVYELDETLKYSRNLQDALKDEEKSGLYTDSFFLDYQRKVNITMKKLKLVIEEQRILGYHIIGYGAAAKGNTVLNMGGFQLDFIIDDSPEKIGTFTPGMNVPVKSIESIDLEFFKKKPVLLIPLAWNFSSEIIDRFRKRVFKIYNYIITEPPTVQVYRYFPRFPVDFGNMKVALESIRFDLTTTVISHFYNEEYLLPHWLTAHKKLFDHGIMINYFSTDKSVEIIKSICPDWEIVNTRTKMFNSITCDDEVKDIERTVTGIKVALNTTEFLRGDVRDLFKLDSPGDLRYKMVKCFLIIDHSPEENLLKNGKNILEVYTHGNELSLYRGIRFIHNFPSGKYDYGRHRLLNIDPDTVDLVPPDRTAIFWYGICPEKEMTTRELNKSKHYDPHDQNRFIFHTPQTFAEFVAKVKDPKWENHRYLCEISDFRQKYSNHFKV